MSASIERCGRHDGVHGPGGPSVFGILPLHGPFGGATPVTITGRGFTGATHASVGGTNIGAFAVVDDSTITGTSPAGEHGFADVVVGGGPPGDITLANAYHYDQNPTVTSVVPSHNQIGGSAVEIHGSGFTGMTGAVVGGLACGPDFHVISDIRIDTEVKPHAWGDVDVTVNGLFGETGTLVSGFHYDQPLATFTSITPDHGSSAGGTPVAIVGANFTTATGAKLGGVALTSFVVVDDNHITGTTGAHANGAADLEIDNDSGAAVFGAVYTYQTPPFDFADLPLTAYFMDRTAAPWLGKASVGNSGTHNLSPVTSTAGTAIDGHTPANYDGVTANGDITFDDASVYLGANGIGSGAILFDARTATPDGGSTPYQDSTLLGTDTFAIYGIGITTSGVVAWMYDGAWESAGPVACSLGAKHLVQWAYDGVHLKLWLDAAAGGAPSASVAVTPGFSGAPFFLSSCNFHFGAGHHGVHTVDGEEALMLLSAVVFSDVDRANIYARAKAVFPSAGLP